MKQPIIFNIRYTPYRLKKGASAEELATHQEERAFYDMSGGKNIFSYITRKDKIIEKANALDYFQKTTGVFNGKGQIDEKELKAIKERAKKNKGNLWHGFISLDEEHSHKIDTPEKCIAFVKHTFGSFFQAAHLDEKNIDLICALHTDRPHHLHIHFLFFEKEPMMKDGKGGVKYRNKGKLAPVAIDTMFVKSGIFISEDKDTLHQTRQESLRKLRALTAIPTVMNSREEIKKAVLELVQALPKTGRLSYGSQNMEPYRVQIDRIVGMLLQSNRQARKADKRFFQALEQRKKGINAICNQPFAFSDQPIAQTKMEKEASKYAHTIDKNRLPFIEEIEKDYRRRQGNLVLGLVKAIKGDLYERKEDKRYPACDGRLKKKLALSHKRVEKKLTSFLISFGEQSEWLERDFTHRLEEIETEMEQNREENEREERYKN